MHPLWPSVKVRATNSPYNIIIIRNGPDFFITTLQGSCDSIGIVMVGHLKTVYCSGAWMMFCHKPKFNTLLNNYIFKFFLCNLYFDKIIKKNSILLSVDRSTTTLPFTRVHTHTVTLRHHPPAPQNLVFYQNSNTDWWAEAAVLFLFISCHFTVWWWWLGGG